MTISQSCALPDISPEPAARVELAEQLAEVRVAAPADEAGRGGGPLNARPEQWVQQGRIAEGVGAPGSRHFQEQPAAFERRCRRERLGSVRARAVRSGLLLTPVLPGQSAASVTGFWRPASVTGFGDQHPRSEQSAVSIWCPDALAACQELAGQRNESAENS